MSAAAPALLVVDDNQDNRYTLGLRLTREGYTDQTTANDGRQALAMLRTRPFDLVLLDIMMPDLDGYQVLEQMKADPALRDIPVIMISAHDDVDNVVRCVELGADDYLSKPFNPALLRARVGTSLEKKRLRDQVRTSLARLEDELQSARVLQLGMLPSRFPVLTPAQPVEVFALMDPAREIGGDLYDAFYAPDGTFCFLVGDVSGKGTAAGMFMARTRSLVRLAVVELRPLLDAGDRSPAYIAQVVNRELCLDNQARMFVSLFLGFLDVHSGELAYINAGHPLPYLLGANGRLHRLTGKPQTPLAVRTAMTYQNHAVTVRAGDALLVCTDGVIEATNPAGELYSAARLEALLRDAPDTTPQALVSRIKQDVDDFADTAAKADDVTLLAVRRPATITTLTITNQIAQMRLVSDAMEQIGARHNVPARTLYHLQVAIDEMVSNVIRHGWPEGGEHQFQVSIAVSGGLDGATQVDIIIIDDGRPFNPLDAPPPAPLVAGSLPTPGGLGIHMVRKFIDRIDYLRQDGHNHLTLTKRCLPGTATR